jgi:cytochrome d ubiquinol oxidase subunit I
MQLPRGFEMGMRAGQEVAVIVDPIAAYLNPRFFFMFTHMQASAVLSAALFMGGIAMYKLTTTDSRRAFWKTSLKLAIVGMLLTAPFMAIQGDAYGRHVYETQPQKFAAMEAVYETEDGVDEYLFAIPTSLEGFTDPSARDLFAVGIPGGASFLASGGDPGATIQGLDDMESLQGVEGEPPVAVVFWSFRAMVGLGMWFILLALWAGYRWYQDRLLDDRYLQRGLIYSIPLGLLAIEFGWIVTEVGRQPWAIQEVLTVADGVSQNLTTGEALLTFVGFVVGYAALLTVWTYLVRRLILRGPKAPAEGAEVVAE